MCSNRRVRNSLSQGEKYRLSAGAFIDLRSNKVNGNSRYIIYSASASIWVSSQRFHVYIYISVLVSFSIYLSWCLSLSISHCLSLSISHGVFLYLSLMVSFSIYLLWVFFPISFIQPLVLLLLSKLQNLSCLYRIVFVICWYSRWNQNG